MRISPFQKCIIFKPVPCLFPCPLSVYGEVTLHVVFLGPEWRKYFLQIRTGYEVKDNQVTWKERRSKKYENIQSGEPPKKYGNTNIYQFQFDVKSHDGDVSTSWTLTNGMFYKYRLPELTITYISKHLYTGEMLSTDACIREKSLESWHTLGTRVDVLGCRNLMKYLVISNAVKPLLHAKTANAYPIAEMIALSGQSPGRNIICYENHSAAQNFNGDGLR